MAVVVVHMNGKTAEKIDVKSDYPNGVRLALIPPPPLKLFTYIIIAHVEQMYLLIFNPSVQSARYPQCGLYSWRGGRLANTYIAH